MPSIHQWASDSPRATNTNNQSSLAALTLRWGILLSLLLLFAFNANDFFLVQIGAQAALLGLIALSLSLLAGWGGMVSLSQLTVGGIAGYTIAILGESSMPLSLGWHWGPALFTAIFVAIVFAALIGLISLRTSGIHTIMITLAIGVAFFYFVNQNYTVFNGFTGFSGLKPPIFGDLDMRQPRHFYFLAVGLALLGYLLCRTIETSSFGFTLKAFRDNSRRVSALGFDVTQCRILAHVLAGFLAAQGGILLVWFNGRISPGTIGIGPMIDILIISVIGGMRRPSGAFIGAIVFVLLKTFAIDLIDRERFNTLIGAFFLVIVLFSPDGILGLYDQFKRKLTR